MKIIAVDDERKALKLMKDAIDSAVPRASVTCFLSAQEALHYAEIERIDVAFLDIEMGRINGIALAKHLKEINPFTNIIFVTAYQKYAMEALDIHVSGYLVKPVKPQRVLEELHNLRYPVQLPRKGVFVRCFGNFQVYVEGTQIRFPRAMSEEVLAYLVHRRGEAVSREELGLVLWPNLEYNSNVRSQLRSILSVMMKTLKAAGAESIVNKQRTSLALRLEEADCENIKYINGDISGINAYKGEYMTQYSWAKFEPDTKSVIK